MTFAFPLCLSRQKKKEKTADTKTSRSENHAPTPRATNVIGGRSCPYLNRGVASQVFLVSLRVKFHANEPFPVFDMVRLHLQSSQTPLERTIIRYLPGTVPSAPFLHARDMPSTSPLNPTCTLRRTFVGSYLVRSTAPIRVPGSERIVLILSRQTPKD